MTTTKTTNKTANPSATTDTYSAYVQSIINKQVAVQTNKARTQQQHNKETGERVYTFTNENLNLVSNPEKVRILLAKYLQKQTVAQIKNNNVIKTAIANKVNISKQRATVLIRDNIEKVAAKMQAK